MSQYNLYIKIRKYGSDLKMVIMVIKHQDHETCGPVDLYRDGDHDSDYDCGHPRNRKNRTCCVVFILVVLLWFQVRCLWQ